MSQTLAKLRLPFLIGMTVLAFAFAGFVLTARPWLFGSPHAGAIAETWETSTGALRIRIDRHNEENSFLPGAYYVFRSAPVGSEAWRDIISFRHDDRVPIPRDQVRLVNDQVAFVFMGWIYAVTTDDGATWSVWDAEHELPSWHCCNY